MTRDDAPISYPKFRTVEVVDDYHGVKVADPYRWLEDPDSAETRAWVEEQNALTFGYLESIPTREAIKRRLTRLWDYEKYDVPFQVGGRYFFFKNDGLQNQSVLYTLPSLDAEARVLLDPNTLSPDGTVALSGLDVSEDGKLLAYGLSASGSDWQEWRVRDIESGTDRDDHVRWVKFSAAAWTRDGSGFFYSRYDEPNEATMHEDTNYFQKLYFHRLGTPQTDDILVYHRPDEPEWGFDGHVTDDGRYLIITIWQGTDRRKRVFYAELGSPPSPQPSPFQGEGANNSASTARPPLPAGEWAGVRGEGPGEHISIGNVIELLSQFDASYEFIDNDGPTFWFHTDLDAPRGRVVAVDTRNPGKDQWREIIPEAEETLEGVGVVHDTFIATYLKDARSVVRLFALDGTPLGELPLPGIGTVGGFGGRRSDTETFYAFTGFTAPATIYRLDMQTRESTIYRRPTVDFDPEQFEATQVFYTSKDGTRVPMFIVHRRGLALDGQNPTVLYGYGGFNIPLTPAFSVGITTWMEMGGVYAVANLRGGGEYGEEWHQAGMKLNKQNVFDDFIAAAEWLIASGYTSTPKLAIHGGSNGGLLVGACMTQRPELFGACLPAVGVMDMLRFHRFTIGWGWVTDYGSPDDPEEFKAIYAYSPLHNLRRGTVYPPTLITTADHDDRVVPAHSFKFATALQATEGGGGPALIRIETRAGHGAGKPTDKVIEEIADRWAFLTRVLEMDVGEGFSG